MRTFFTIAGCVGVILTLSFVAIRVTSHQDGERDVFGEPQTAAQVALIRPRHELVAARLAAGDSTSFELCIGAPLVSPLTVEVWHRGDAARVTTEVIEGDRLASLNGLVNAQPEGACEALAPLELRMPGEYALAVTWADDPETPPPEALADVPLRGHVIGLRAISSLEKGSVVLALVLTLLALMAQLLKTTASGLPQELRKAKRSPWVTVALALGSLLGVMIATAFLPMRGAVAGLTSGALLAGAQIVAVLFLSESREQLALKRSRWIYVAPVIGVTVFVAGRLVASLIPATGVAPITTLVSWPSGMLAVAAIAVVVPVVEELFFRGLLYGALSEKSEALAIGGTIVAFSAAHLPQQWGAWGACAAVMLTGVVLTLLRRVTGSTVVCAVAHLAHNAVITWFALR